MIHASKALLVAPILSLLSACAGFGQYPVGLIYSGTQTPSTMDRAEVTGTGKTGDKRGEACAAGYLGLIAVGDATVDAAKKSAGITEVHSIELKATQVLFFYSQLCTVAWGK